jgi:uncharacterized sulfatase
MVPALRERPKDKPFFLWAAFIDPHRPYGGKDGAPKVHKPEDVFVPPYLPDGPETRRDLAEYYDEVTRMDGDIGQVLAELDRQGVADNTLVLFLSDNGRPFPRCKTTVYDSGIQTPLLARWPGKIRPGGTCDRLVSAVDIAPTLLELAGVKGDDKLQGNSFARLLTEPAGEPTREFIFAEHNWHDYTARERAVRSTRYKYIRNDYPDLPGTPPADAVRSPTFQEMRKLRDEGKLTPAQASVFVKPRPIEEFYDTQDDPHELTNRIADPKLSAEIARHRAALNAWQVETADGPPRERTPDGFDRETGEPKPNRGRVAPTSSRMSSPRVNIVAVVCDDLANWALGCYGGPDAVTPHLDRLAKQGSRFTNAFVATPVCSPSRASYLTGRYGTQLGITDWISRTEESAGVGLPTDTLTWPAVLKQHGYTTGLFGKWHLGRHDPFLPTRHGFDQFYGFLGGETQSMTPVFDFPTGPRELRGCSADLVTDEAVSFITTNRDRPFVACIHYREPHMPYGPMPEQDTGVFRGKDLTIPKAPGIDPPQITKWTREYLTAVHAIDRNVGRLLAELDRQGIADRTLVLFTSDHGYNIGHHSVHGKGNAYWVAGGLQRVPRRPNMWDHSIRVPLIVRGPGVATDAVATGAVSNIDTYATMLDAVGVPAPADWKHEGTSFAPLMRDPATPGRDIIFAQYDLHNYGSARMRMARTEQWKLVRHYEGKMLDEMYDLTADPGEEQNLFPFREDAKYPLNPKAAAVAQELDSQLYAWMAQINDPLLQRISP